MVNFSMKIVFFMLIVLSEDAYGIWEGHDAEPGDFPYQVAIYVLGLFACGGAIITNDHILTAAHCVIGKPHQLMYVLAGTIKLNDPNGIYKGVEAFKLHPEFRPTRSIHDIAVIRLESSYTPQDNVSPIPFATYDWPSCALCDIAGWGPSSNGSGIHEDLLWTAMTILPHHLCAMRAKSISETCQFCAACDFEVATADKVCQLLKENVVALESKGRRRCIICGDFFCEYETNRFGKFQGDSGGPLVCNGIIVGINSMTEYNPKSAVIFTKVFPYSEFIHKYVSNHHNVS